MGSALEDLASTNRDVRFRSAVRLGHERTAGAGDAIVRRLPVETDEQVFNACCAALELLGDTSVVPALTTLLGRCPANHLFQIGHVLTHLTGIDPYLPPDCTARAIRRRWLRALTPASSH